MGIGWDWLLPAAALAATAFTGGAAAPALAAAEAAGTAGLGMGAEAAAALVAEQAAAAAAAEAAAASAAATGAEAAASASALPTAAAGVPEAAASGVDYASMLNPAEGAMAAPGVPQVQPGFVPGTTASPTGQMTPIPGVDPTGAPGAELAQPSMFPKMSPEMQKGIKAAQLMNTLVNQPEQSGGNSVGTTANAPAPRQGITPMQMVGGQNMNPASWQGMQQQRPSLGQILYPQRG